MYGNSTIKTAYLSGGKACDATVNVEISKGIGIHLIGLPDRYVRESLLRIVTALQATGFNIPGAKIVITVEPAQAIKGTGAGFDLPIAVAILDAAGKLPELRRNMGDFYFWGELGLDGTIVTYGGEKEIINHLRFIESVIVCPKRALALASRTNYYRRDYVCICNSLKEVCSYATAHRYRGIEIRPVPVRHLLYEHGDRWAFWNPTVKLTYSCVTIEGCCESIDDLAERGLIEPCYLDDTATTETI